MTKYEMFGTHSQAMTAAVWTLDHFDRFNFNALVRRKRGGSKKAKGGHHPVLVLDLIAFHSPPSFAPQTGDC